MIEQIAYFPGPKKVSRCGGAGCRHLGCLHTCLRSASRHRRRHRHQQASSKGDLGWAGLGWTGQFGAMLTEGAVCCSSQLGEGWLEETSVVRHLKDLSLAFRVSCAWEVWHCCRVGLLIRSLTSLDCRNSASASRSNITASAISDCCCSRLINFTP
jgi:hypothetical protein